MTLNPAFRKVYYGMLLIRNGGLGIFWHQLKRQIYSKTTFFGLERDLQTNSVHVPCGIDYSLQLASKDDMDEILQRSKSEGRESVHDPIQ